MFFNINTHCSTLSGVLWILKEVPSVHGGDVDLQSRHQDGDSLRFFLFTFLLFLIFYVNSVLNRNGDSQHSGLDFCGKNSKRFYY